MNLTPSTRGSPFRRGSTGLPRYRPDCDKNHAAARANRSKCERLLGGNWKICPAAGLYFKREWCAVIDEVPVDLDVVRYWDLAATEKTEFNDGAIPLRASFERIVNRHPASGMRFGFAETIPSHSAPDHSKSARHVVIPFPRLGLENERASQVLRCARALAAAHHVL